MTLNPAQDKFVLKRQLTPSPGFAKTTPYLPCAGTHFRSAYRRIPGFESALSSGNAYSLNRRAVIRNWEPVIYILQQNKFIMISNGKILKYPNKIERINIPLGSSGLDRSHRLIRIEKEKELLFLKICAQIKFNEYKKDRSDNQRESRRLIRQNKISNTRTNWPADYTWTKK